MIEIKKLSKKYGTHKVFDNLNLCINNNEIVAIIGPSGCGKSTLLNIIGQIENNYDGSIIINGINLKKVNRTTRERFIRYNINYLFQNFALIDSLSVKDNLMIGLEYVKIKKSEKEERIKKVLKKVKLNNYSDKRIYELSGGEQQRVALARIMLKPGDIVLADEPTGNLDKENGNLVIDILKSLKKSGKTIVIVTHSEEIANQCDRIINL